MTRPALFLACALAALVLASCGDDSDEGAETTRPANPPATATQSVGGAPIGATARRCKTDSQVLRSLRATGIDCAEARRVMLAWAGFPACKRNGPSRFSCLVRGYRCLGVITDRGISVSCARQGRSLSFIADVGRAE